MKGIYTRVSTIEDADDLGHFIMGFGYEGVQNDSYRYCKLQMKYAIDNNARHHNPHCFVGVNGGRLVVGANRKAVKINDSLIIPDMGSRGVLWVALVGILRVTRINAGITRNLNLRR